MKKLLVVSAIAALGLTSGVYAGGLPGEMPAAPAAIDSDAGLYVGITGGWGVTNWKNTETGTNKVKNDNGVVGRAMLGYDFNKYFAAEFGYSYFFNKAKFLQSGSEDNYLKFKTQAFDLFGKIKAPITDELSVYGKLGVNYLLSSRTKTGTVTSYTDNTQKPFNIAYGVGLDYAITPNIIANLDWTRYTGKGKVDTNYVPNTEALMIGLKYKFDL